MQSSIFVPRQAFFTKGAGKHRNRLQSFEVALRSSGIEKYNLVTVSSILPAGCKLISKQEGIKQLSPGQITYAVIARADTDEPARLIGAGVGLAVPAEGEQYGYISEHHGYGMSESWLSDYVEDMAATMLATTLGIEFDPDKAYDDRKEIYNMSGKIVQTRANVQTATGDKDGLWTTVISAVILLP